MKALLSISTILLCLTIQAQVGINTNYPEEELHIGGATGSIRIESLNAANNGYNSGSDSAPLFLDKDGNFTIEYNPYVNSVFGDFFDGNLSTFKVTENSSGFIEQELHTESITVSRDSYVELKYSISYEVYLNSSLVKITDAIARNIQTYILLDGSTARKYGQTARCYTNGNTDGIPGVLHQIATTYIHLTAGTHTISFYGAIGSLSSSYPTYVEFGKQQDMLFYRIL